MIRTYRLKHNINQGKQRIICQIIKQYRHLAKSIAAVQWRNFFTNQKFDKNLKIKAVPTELSARYKQTCQYQVVGVLESFICNRQNDFAKMLTESSLPEQTKEHLLHISARRLWFSRTEISDQKGEKISKPTIHLARKIFKRVLSKHQRPNLGKCNLALDDKVAKVSAKVSSQTKAARHFDYWITLSTLQKGKTIALPLKTNPYFEQKPGRLNKFCQINITRDNSLNVCLVKTLPKSELYQPKTPKIALDLGLRNLLACNTGSLFGRDFIEKLSHYDQILTKLAAHRQRQGLKTSSTRYARLVRSVKSLLKNEINRILNNIVRLYAPKEICIENLNFCAPKLSKRLNRLLSKFGKAIITKKLHALSEEFGIVITKVPCPYSSKTCSHCGYVDPRNRISQSLFVCLHCKFRLHADVNAARNLALRSSDELLSNIYLHKKAILKITVTRFFQRHPRAHSCANHSMHSNPYFRGYDTG